MQKHGDVSINTKNLKDLNIKHFSLDFYKSVCHQEEDFCAVQSLIENAHGLVIATPVWNYSVPAHLINLIDRMGSFALDETRRKGTLKGLPSYIIFTAGVPMIGWTAMMEKATSCIAEALQYFGASYMGHHFEQKCTLPNGNFGLIVDKRPASLTAVEEKGLVFAKVVAEYERTGKAPLANRARGRIMRMGEKLLKAFT